MKTITMETTTMEQAEFPGCGAMTLSRINGRSVIITRYRYKAKPSNVIYNLLDYLIDKLPASTLLLGILIKRNVFVLRLGCVTQLSSSLVSRAIVLTNCVAKPKLTSI